MVPLLSLSHKQREQLGEILGGVKDPERVAKRGYVVRPDLGEWCRIQETKNAV